MPGVRNRIFYNLDREVNDLLEEIRKWNYHHDHYALRALVMKVPRNVHRFIAYAEDRMDIRSHH